MGTLDQFKLLLRIHLRMLAARARRCATEARFMSATIAGFLLAYVAAAYILFSRGLAYIAQLPAAGSLISDRLIHVMFFCFFLMLVFSVAVTSYISLYRSRDTRWLLTLPLSHRAVFLWKCFESSLFSGWGLVVILAPLLAAFARSREVGPEYYLKVGLATVPFLVVACCLGCLVLVVAVRFLDRRQIAAAAAVCLAILAVSAIRSGLDDRRAVEANALSAALTFQRVLGHTDLAVNRALPSTWLSGAAIDWTRPYREGSLLYPALLASHALMAMLLLAAAGRSCFYASWNRSVQQSARSALRRRRRLLLDAAGAEREFPRPPALARLIGRPLAAISRKDLLTFVREPAQWVQFSLVFGLLAIYASGLQKMNNDLQQPRDVYLVAFLNLAVCALALSTVTTRFVFPQFSLEGRRLWILAMSPLNLPSVVTQKFVTATLGSGLTIAFILFVGGYNLQLGWRESAFFALAVLLLAVGLNALAVSLGVLFPNLEESNAAKIVSGFGGTLCLVGSFVYILATVLLLAYARWDVFATNEVDPFWLEDPQKQGLLLAVVSLTALVAVPPIIFSRKKLKRLEILSNL